MSEPVKKKEGKNFLCSHASLKGVTAICSADRNMIALDNYRQCHCLGLYQLPAAE